MRDLNIDFIAKSTDPKEAADIIAEDMMNDFGTNSSGFWNMSSKNLLSLLLLYVAKAGSIPPEKRETGTCLELISEPKHFADVIHEEILSDPELKYMAKQYKRWIESDTADAAAENVQKLLSDKLNN